MNTRQGNLRLIWATFALMIMVGIGAAFNAAKATDATVPVSGTIAAAIQVSVDQAIDNGLWTAGLGNTTWSMSAVDGTITILNAGNYAPFGNGTPGQLTVTGSPGAAVSIVQTSPGQRTVDSFFDISTLTCMTGAVAEAPCTGAGITDAFDGSGSLTVKLGVGAGEWEPAGGGPAPAAIYTVNHTIAVNYL
jgi:hypothetical protein